jgi:hypothetical protein
MNGPQEDIHMHTKKFSGHFLPCQFLEMTTTYDGRFALFCIVLSDWQKRMTAEIVNLPNRKRSRFRRVVL